MVAVLLSVLILAQTNPAQMPAKTPASGKSSEPIDFKFDQISELKTESEIKIVLDKYTKLIKEDPSESSDIYLARAGFFSRLREYNRALADVMRYSNSVKDYDFLNDRIVGTKYATLKDYCFAAGIKVLNQNSTAREYLERALAREALTPELIDFTFVDAADALKRNPALTSAHLVRAKILIQKGKIDEGIAEANVALAQEADNVGALSIRAVGYAIKNDFPRSLADLNRAIALDPELAFLYNAFGVRMQIYTALGKTDLAAADMQKGQQLAKIVEHIQQMKVGK